ncbi:MAG: molybdenum cofactor biosynthesis protein MoaE [Flavobacteriales bacterium]|jgi:molybdopterin synthase catalytic subunit
MNQSFKLELKALSMDDIRPMMANDTSGAHVIFVGTVRNSSKGEAVTHLEFEAYESMAIKELERIAEHLRSQFPIHAIALHHRLGVVRVGEDAVIAAVSAAHRQAAFDACEALMNELKRSVPIWKKEFTTSGEVWVTPTP